MTHCSTGHLAHRAVEKERKLNPKPIDPPKKKTFWEKFLDIFIRSKK